MFSNTTHYFETPTILHLFAVETCEWCEQPVRAANSIKVVRSPATDARFAHLTEATRMPAEQYHSDETGCCVCEACDGEQLPRLRMLLQQELGARWTVYLRGRTLEATFGPLVFTVHAHTDSTVTVRAECYKGTCAPTAEAVLEMVQSFGE